MAVCGDKLWGQPSPDTSSPSQAPQRDRKPPRFSTARNNTATPLPLCLVFLSLSYLQAVPAQSPPVEHCSLQPNHQRPTPFLNAIGAATSWGVNSIASTAGYDLVPRAADNGFAKRHIESGQMDTKRIVFACMIPVLVCLSGVFAGLSLA